MEYGIRNLESTGKTSNSNPNDESFYEITSHHDMLISGINKLFRVSKNWDLFYKFRIVAIVFFIILALNFKLYPNDLYIGTTTIDITPELPIALDGQMHLRIARKAETQLEANVAVLE